VINESDGRWGAAREIVNPDGNGAEVLMKSISCPSPGSCVAVGDYVNQGQAFVVSETRGVWGSPLIVAGSASGGADLSAVSCPAVGDCLAGGSLRTQALVVEESGGSWGTRSVLAGSLDVGAAVTSVSCPSPGKCGLGGYYDGQPTGPLPDAGYPFVATESGGNLGSVHALRGPFTGVAADNVDAVTSVSCSSAGDCGAGGYYGAFQGQQHAFVAAEKGGRWGTAQEVAGSLDVGHRAEVASISCPRNGNCAAGGWYIDGRADPQAFVVDESGGVWKPAREVAGSLNVGGRALIQSVSCVAASTCSAAGYYTSSDGGFVALVVTESSGSWGAGRAVAKSPIADAKAEVASISCPALGGCTAGGLIDDANAHEQAFVIDEKPTPEKGRGSSKRG
jgi:hypothetical protein